MRYNSRPTAGGGSEDISTVRTYVAAAKRFLFVRSFVRTFRAKLFQPTRVTITYVRTQHSAHSLATAHGSKGDDTRATSCIKSVFLCLCCGIGTMPASQQAPCRLANKLHLGTPTP